MKRNKSLWGAILTLFIMQVTIPKDIFIKKNLGGFLLRLKRGLHCYVSKDRVCDQRDKEVIYKTITGIISIVTGISGVLIIKHIYKNNKHVFKRAPRQLDPFIIEKRSDLDRAIEQANAGWVRAIIQNSGMKVDYLDKSGRTPLQKVKKLKQAESSRTSRYVSLEEIERILRISQ